MNQESIPNLRGGNVGARTTTMRMAQRFLVSLCVGFFIALAWSQSERGVDQRFYLRWSDAAVSGDIERLGAGLPRSVCGIPFFHWQAGTGMIAVPARWAAGALGHADQTVQITGFLCAGLFWWTFWWALRELSDPPRAWFGCALAAVATPLGYYSLSVSSETVSLFPLGVLLLQFCRGLRGRPASVVAIAAAAALLMTIRSYLGVYAWPAMFVAVVQSARRGRARLAATLAVLASGVAVAVAQIAVVNFWMTGSPWDSPYRFGDAQFSSLDWTCPHGSRVLLETFHGLFPTHPFMLLGLGALAALAIRPSNTAPRGYWESEACGGRLTASAVPERPAWGIVLLAVAVHVYFQGCWYYWWVAEISFGMRGLVAASVPAVLAFIRLAAIGRFPHVAGSFRDRNRVSERPGHVKCANDDLPNRRLRIAGAFLRLVITLALACAAWSWLLWLQGPMDYLDWGSMGEGQWLRIQTWMDLEMVAIVLAGVIVMAVFWWACLGGSWDRWTVFAAGLLVSVTAHLLERIVFQPPENLLAFYGLVAAATVLTGIGSSRRLRRRCEVRAATKLVACLLLAASIAAFSHLAWHTQRRLVRLTGDFATFNADDAAAAYKTLNQIPRFSTQRNSLRGYLTRTLGEAWCRDQDRIIQGGEEVHHVKSQGTRTRMRNAVKD